MHVCIAPPEMRKSPLFHYFGFLFCFFAFWFETTKQYVLNHLELFAPLAIFDIPICYVCSQFTTVIHNPLLSGVRSDGIIGNRCIFISFRNPSQWPPIHHTQYTICNMQYSFCASFLLCVRRFLSTKWINLILNGMNLTSCIWILMSRRFSIHLKETHLCRWKIGNEMKQTVCIGYCGLCIVHTYTKCIDHHNKQQQSSEQCFSI